VLNLHAWLGVLPDQVAGFLGTEHHEFTFTVEEGIDALYDLIWHIESYEQVGDLHSSGSMSSPSICCVPLHVGIRHRCLPRDSVHNPSGCESAPHWHSQGVLIVASQSAPEGFVLDAVSAGSCARAGAEMMVMHAGARGRAHVPARAKDQGGRLQSGAERGGRGRDLRRLPLLPQGAQPSRVPAVRGPSPLHTPAFQAGRLCFQSP
jgi:hypothetical protein